MTNLSINCNQNPFAAFQIREKLVARGIKSTRDSRRAQKARSWINKYNTKFEFNETSWLLAAERVSICSYKKWTQECPTEFTVAWFESRNVEKSPCFQNSRCKRYWYKLAMENSKNISKRCAYRTMRARTNNTFTAERCRRNLTRT